MRYLQLVFAFLLLALPLAALEQVEEVTLSLTDVPRFINVTTTLDTTRDILPDHEYRGTVTVQWVVSDSALAQLTSDHVTIYTRVEPVLTNTWLWFEQDGVKLQALTFTLDCFLANGTCGLNSSLSRTFTVAYRAPLGAQLPREERLRVNASLNQLPPSAPYAQLQQEVQTQVEQAQATTGGGGSSSGGFGSAQVQQAVQTAQQLAQQAGQLAAQGEESLAYSALFQARGLLELANRTQSSLRQSGNLAGGQDAGSTGGQQPVQIGLPQQATQVVEAFTGMFSTGQSPLAFTLLLVVLIVGVAVWSQHRRHKRRSWRLDDVAAELEQEQGLSKIIEPMEVKKPSRGSISYWKAKASKWLQLPRPTPKLGRR